MARFAGGARWLKAMIEGEDRTGLVPLFREVRPRGPKPASTSSWCVQFDASVWGGGAILRCGEAITEYMHCTWDESTVQHLGVCIGDPRHQTLWEFLTLLMSLMIWGGNFLTEEVALLGDNTASLADALDLKGRGVLMDIARELSWRKARFGWQFAVGHVPSERNSIPDALSRLQAVPPCTFPKKALARAVQRDSPDQSRIWRAGV